MRQFFTREWWREREWWTGGENDNGEGDEELRRERRVKMKLRMEEKTSETIFQNQTAITMSPTWGFTVAQVAT